MNQVHVQVGKHRSDHASMKDAINSIRLRVLFRRIDSLIDSEMVALLRILFCLD